MLWQKRASNSVHWYMNELTSRIVASSGRPSDRFHLGKMVLQSLKDAPDYVLQIDGATGQAETSKSVLKRTVQCADALRALGLQRGDVIVVMAPNHLDVAIPLYAALYNGIIYAPIDRTLTVDELQITFKVITPKLVLCQSEKVLDVQQACKNADVHAQIITFDKGNTCLSFSELLEKYENLTDVQSFKPAEFDTEETISFLIPTSGTTGVPKSSMSTHQNIAGSTHYFWTTCTEFPMPSQTCLIVSALQWISALANIYLSPILRFTILMSSQPMTQEHAYHVINTYKPTFMIISPSLMTTLLKPGDRNKCDFSCFEYVAIGGSAVPSKLIEELEKITPGTKVVNVYGMSEVHSFACEQNCSPSASCGSPAGHLTARLINDGADINEPNIVGELWLKGPTVFKGYYNDPVKSEETFAEDRWYKTGDLFYRDERWNMYFVDRIKLLLKYRNHQVSPVEVENVIRKHPGVLDVAVTGVPDAECGDLPVACVVRAPGHSVTAHEIKQIVKGESVIRKHPGVLDVAVTGVPDAECGDLPVACVVRAPGHSVTAHEIKQIVKGESVIRKHPGVLDVAVTGVPDAECGDLPVACVVCAPGHSVTANEIKQIIKGESVIHKHPGVLDVAVTGVPDAECGDLPVACGVRAPGRSVTAHEIKQIVKDSLTDTKQLRGGVIFLDQLPLTSTLKPDRRTLKEMVLRIERE